jgi:hypothetical protein
MLAERCVYIVDDDEAVRDSLAMRSAARWGLPSVSRFHSLILCSLRPTMVDDAIPYRHSLSTALLAAIA